MGSQSTNGPSYPPSMSSETSDLKLEIPRIILDPCLPYTGCRLDNELSFASVDWDGPRQPLTQMEVLPEGPLVGPWGCLPGRFQSKYYCIQVRTSHINFIQNKHVKLDKTCLDTQGCFKANLSNVMDIVGRLTSKLHETCHTAYIHYNNSFKDLTI